ncbi:MAG: hypothetical protein F6K48_10715 [Okeania sp. SIO3H1]|nr:hypothetical protein [Okeania sp. SIO3H1]
MGSLRHATLSLYNPKQFSAPPLTVGYSTDIKINSVSEWLVETIDIIPDLKAQGFLPSLSFLGGLTSHRLLHPPLLLPSREGMGVD